MSSRTTVYAALALGAFATAACSLIVAEELSGKPSVESTFWESPPPPGSTSADRDITVPDGDSPEDDGAVGPVTGDGSGDDSQDSEDPPPPEQDAGPPDGAVDDAQAETQHLGPDMDPDCDCPADS